MSHMASKDWVKFNEDSRAAGNRAAHVAKYGGEFTYRGRNRGWCWAGGHATPPKKAEKPVAVKKSTVEKSKKK